MTSVACCTISFPLWRPYRPFLYIAQRKWWPFFALLAILKNASNICAQWKYFHSLDFVSISFENYDYFFLTTISISIGNISTFWILLLFPLDSVSNHSGYNFQINRFGYIFILLGNQIIQKKSKTFLIFWVVAEMARFSNFGLRTMGKLSKIGTAPRIMTKLSQ